MSTAELNSNGENDKKPAKEKDAVPVQARRRKTLVYVVSHIVAAVVHLWSLGVLTAAGCGIGSVHEVSLFKKQEAKNNRKLELERRRSAGALSVDDISSDVIIQQMATVE
ncbi:hypothetical protein F511_41181 [Dorcoceras hygrometricum]|uniref:Uncharacterized protein n=1 Tax=Dorcoceras hygrometricum TaxID=472368 RepID=A0A2Z7A7F8_9LAMI|nr:hypothetical protein F511_41181 [Dorcoceras hygrometricum]